MSRSVVAFANGASGEILIGVDDKDIVRGLAEDQINNYPDRIAASIADTCTPLIVPDLFRTTIENKSVIAVKIYPVSAKPYFFEKYADKKNTDIDVFNIKLFCKRNTNEPVNRY